ncbi:hypothetical protein RJ641_031953 [Dillenia turbinata]|uniref:Uncharacterized protein n=1 Tax=Dillenia turbinata TaxID=194707 RepID=A0AAN8ZLH5_9MAGN
MAGGQENVKQLQECSVSKSMISCSQNKLLLDDGYKLSSQSCRNLIENVCGTKFPADIIQSGKAHIFGAHHIFISWLLMLPMRFQQNLTYLLDSGPKIKVCIGWLSFWDLVMPPVMLLICNPFVLVSLSSKHFLYTIVELGNTAVSTELSTPMSNKDLALGTWVFSVLGALVAIPVGIKRKSLAPLVFFGTTGTMLDIILGVSACEREHAERQAKLLEAQNSAASTTFEETTATES